MKIKCENVIICGNYKCAWNCDCRCGHDVVALDANGKCSLEKPRNSKPLPDPAGKNFNAC